MTNIISKHDMLKDNTTFVDGVQQTWSASSITLYQECPRKYELKQLYGWQPKGTSSVHLVFGKHYAMAMESLYRKKFEGATIDEALHAVVKELLSATWDTETSAPWDSGDNLKSRETLIRSIVWYVEEFRDIDLKVVQLTDGTPAVEHKFTLAVGDGIILSGFLDRVVEFQGSKYIMDQKTTKAALSPSYFNQFTPNNQVSMYSMVSKIILDTAIAGVIIDAAQIAVGFTRFSRFIASRTPPMLDEWYNETMLWIQSAQKASRENHFPQNNTSCGNYGGCVFRSICGRAPGARAAFLSADFEQVKRHQPESTT